MLRQSIRRFLENKYKYQYRLGKKYGVTMTKLNDNNFHKKLRDEILMIAIPKPKFVNHQSSTNYEGKTHAKVISKQSHFLSSAIDRVSKL